jgi:hypothetical protein
MSASDFVVGALVVRNDGTVVPFCNVCGGTGKIECECGVDPHDDHPCEWCGGSPTFERIDTLSQVPQRYTNLNADEGERIIFVVTLLSSLEHYIAFDTAEDAFLCKRALMDMEYSKATALFTTRRAA